MFNGSPTPPPARSLADLRRDHRANRPDSVLLRTRRCTRVLPGRGMTFLPFWPEAAEVGGLLGRLCAG